MHKHVGHIAISHLEFGVQFKEMLVNAFPKGCVIHFHNDAGGDGVLSEAMKKLELPVCSCFDMGYMVYTN